MIRGYLRSCVLLFVLTAIAPAAEEAGIWNVSYRMPDGYRHESTLDLQIVEGKLAGKISSKRGSVPIDEGGVSGSDIWFAVTRRGNGDELKVEFRGTVQTDTMKLKMSYRDHAPIDLIAKRSRQ